MHGLGLSAADSAIAVVFVEVLAVIAAAAAAAPLQLHLHLRWDDQIISERAGQVLLHIVMILVFVQRVQTSIRR